jgi:outer membrane protein assembly factor BamB
MRQNTSNTGRRSTFHPTLATAPKASSTTTGGLIFSTPVIDENEIIYVGSSDHIVRAYNPFTKKVEWEFTTNEVIDSAGALHPNGTIIIPSGDGTIYCLNKSGNKLWSFDVTKNRTPDQFSFATSYWWEGNIAIDPEGNIYAGNDDFFLYCLTPDGNLKWKFRTGLFIWASVVFSEPGMVYASSFDGVIYAIARSTGKLAWKTDTKNPIISSPTVYKNTLFQCTLGGTLLALHISTGKITWSEKIPSHVYASPLITEDGHIITASSDGNIIAFDIETKQQTWSWDDFSVIRSSPVAGPDPEGICPYLIYCGNADGHLFALTPDGTLRYRLHTAPKTENPQKFVINASLAVGNYGIAAPVGKYIYYIPFDHFKQSSQEEIIVERKEQQIINVDTLRAADTYVLDNIHVTAPTIIPTLDQIGLQSLRITIGVIDRNEENQTFLAHGSLIFGRNDAGDLVGVPHSQTYSFAFHGSIKNDYLTLHTQNIYFETSGFPFPLDTLTLRVTSGPQDTNATLRAEVIEKGPLKTFASVILAYNTSHPPQSVLHSVTTIQDIPYIIYALYKLLAVSSLFFIRQYWKDWGLFDSKGSIHCIGMAALRALPEHEHKISWQPSNFIFEKTSNTILIEVTQTDEHARQEEVSIIIAEKNTLIPLPINYSAMVKRKRISKDCIRISLTIPEQYLHQRGLVVYVVNKTTLLASYELI